MVLDESGKRRELKLEQVLGKEGLYTARFIPNRYGEYTLTATGTLDGEKLRRTTDPFRGKNILRRI